jgi:hypothetical protein
MKVVENRKSMNRPHFLVPTIATGLLLLLMYVGTYLALVGPTYVYIRGDAYGGNIQETNYRWYPELAERFYWPLERIHRKLNLRPWPLESPGPERPR